MTTRIDFVRLILTIALGIALAVDISWYLWLYATGHTPDSEARFGLVAFILVILLQLTHKYVRRRRPT